MYVGFERTSGRGGMAIRFVGTVVCHRPNHGCNLSQLVRILIDLDEGKNDAVKRVSG